MGLQCLPKRSQFRELCIHLCEAALKQIPDTSTAVTTAAPLIDEELSDVYERQAERLRLLNEANM